MLTKYFFRTKVIRWRVVVWSFTEVMLVIFYMAFIFERLLIPVFRQFGASPLEPRALVLSVFGTMMPGTLAFLCGFYCLLHSWLNATAELLRFADRMFYKVRFIAKKKKKKSYNFLSIRIGGTLRHTEATIAHGTWLFTTGCTCTYTRTCTRY